jgi:hypothetical protein
MLRPAHATRFSLLIAAAVGNALVVLMLSSVQPDAHAQTQVPTDTPANFEVISIQTIDPAVLSFRQPGAPPLAGMSNVGGERRGLARDSPVRNRCQNEHRGEPRDAGGAGACTDAGASD